MIELGENEDIKKRNFLSFQRKNLYSRFNAKTFSQISLYNGEMWRKRKWSKMKSSTFYCFWNMVVLRYTHLHVNIICSLLYFSAQLSCIAFFRSLSFEHEKISGFSVIEFPISLSSKQQKNEKLIGVNSVFIQSSLISHLLELEIISHNYWFQFLTFLSKRKRFWENMMSC